MDKFLDVCNTFEKIDGVSSRNEMMEILSTFFSELDSENVARVAYLLDGRVAPRFIPAEYNYSEKGLIKVLSGIFGRDVSELRKELGDIGNVAYKVSSEGKTKGDELSIEQVYEELWKIVNAGGSGSMEYKDRLVSDLLGKLSPLEGKYFCRIISGNLRLGASVKTLLDSFSLSLSGDKGLRELLDAKYGISADIGYIAQCVYSIDAKKVLENVSITPGVPILPRLVERVKSFEEAFDRLGESFYIQPKYDGLRCQIHKYKKEEAESLVSRVWNGKINSKEAGLFSSEESVEVRLFTRNLEDVTSMFPEIVEDAKKMGEQSFVLDGEIIGWNERMSEFLSYQDTMTRRRKYDIASTTDLVPVSAFVFDVLYLNGESLVAKDLIDRVNILNKVGFIDRIKFSDSKAVSNVADLKKEFKTAVGKRLEGLVAKKIEGGYLPGVRNYDWVKIKKSISKDLVDSVDLVVLGYYKGSGKRSSFGIGAILGGVYSPDEDRYESLTKIGTGVTDDMWKTIIERLKPLEVEKRPKNVLVEDILEPDVWISPEVVMSVDADEVSKNRSRNDVAGGYSLRFPRLIEFDRDKANIEATTVSEIASMRK